MGWRIEDVLRAAQDADGGWRLHEQLVQVVAGHFRFAKRSIAGFGCFAQRGVQL